jgi:ABC-type transporter Mla MlaB component
LPSRVVRRRSDVQSNTLILSGPIARADIPALCSRAHHELEGCHPGPVDCDVEALIDPDAVTVDALARLQLTAQRLGRRVRLRGACRDLQELLGLCGLGDVLPLCGESGLESRGEAEERE